MSSINETDKIDFVTLGKDFAELIIADNIEWEPEPDLFETGALTKANSVHYELLNNKIGTYIYFVESGQLFESYPDAKQKAKEIRIKVYGQFPLNDAGKIVIEKSRAFVESVGEEIGVNLRLVFEQFEEDD